MNRREKDALAATMKWFFHSVPQPQAHRDDPNITLFNAMAVALIELKDSQTYDGLAAAPTLEDAYNRGYTKGFDDGYADGIEEGRTGDRYGEPK